MRVIITRHGETYHNMQGISMGQGIDGPLSEQGVFQAKQLANYLSKEPITRAYVSSLQRAIHTGRIILEHHPAVEMILVADLRERNLGIYEGRPNTEWKKAMASAPDSFAAFQPNNGESYEILARRVVSFWESLIKHDDESTILVVSHTGALTMLLLHILNLPITRENYERYKPGNTAVTIVEITNGLKNIAALNSLEHLAA